VVGGYKGGANTFDTLMVGDYERREPRFAGKVSRAQRKQRDSDRRAGDRFHE
jgi:hypothetical protein